MQHVHLTQHTTDKHHVTPGITLYAVTLNGEAIMADTPDLGRATDFAAKEFNLIKSKAELRHWNGDTGQDELLQVNF